ncbi:Sporulation related domain [Legionella steigerwaltii]|uniref:Sporulation related domain n=1 Tax=Legionella steigerwaltii TaxID=460 RepID=A0A378LE12_9GAMM|nr:SPOR domain-containing protein [Legionella steigerwaltii]KTD79495.1 Sporulation related domain protein [Legionella steigerwaltii]STY24620.1 Sporulation related domain [Legionella steigerwaltii]
MKWQYYSKLSVAIGFSLISFSSLSAQTIYGLHQARQFRSNTSSDFYIQLASYKNKSYALRAKSQIQRKSNYPVLLKEKNGYYQILLGPFHSTTEVRAAAQEFGVTTPMQRVSQNTPTTKAKITRPSAPVVQNSAPVAVTKKDPVVPVYKDKDGVLPANHWFIGVGGGWMDPFGTDATNFASSGMPGFPDDRYVTNSSDSTGQISGFVGYQWRRAALWFPATSLSFEYTYTFPIHINGVIFVNDLPDAKNFTYKYDITQQLPMAKLKLDLYQWKQFMPYISGGVGVALNRVSDYSDSPIPGATVMERRFGFSSTTTTQFAGSFGAGLDYWFNYNAQISVGYELAYYGKARTGDGQGTLSDNHLENNLNSNGVVVKGTYFFN